MKVKLEEEYQERLKEQEKELLERAKHQQKIEEKVRNLFPY